jgi:small subunit ribosomal protein S20
MANTKSALKAIRTTKRKTVINLRTKRAYKDASKEVRKAVTGKDLKKAEGLLPEAFKAIDKAAKNKIIHKNTAGRYKAQLSKMIKA